MLLYTQRSNKIYYHSYLDTDNLKLNCYNANFQDISSSTRCDNPKKTLNASLNLLLQLKDGPDKPPIFIISPTSATIPEDSTVVNLFQKKKLTQSVSHI